MISILNIKNRSCHAAMQNQPVHAAIMYIFLTRIILVM